MAIKTTNDDLEYLAESIQKYLTNHPAILIGSGCSVPYGLPSMSQLADELISTLSHKYASNCSWNDFVARYNATQNLETALESVDMDQTLHDEIIKCVWECISKADNDAFQLFLEKGEFPHIGKIVAKCIQSVTKTNIITTNYDRLIEYAIDKQEGKCVSGYCGTYLKRFTGFNSIESKRTINLFKVHGSVDWFKNISTGSICSVDFRDSSCWVGHYSPLIVTPGIQKYRETHYDPFRTMISEADKAIRQSSSYLCVGYGFNDEHIEPIIIEENREKEKPIVIVTKGITPKMESLFLSRDDIPYLIISEHESGGSIVYWGKNDYKVFEVPFWKLSEFTNLWLG